MPNFEALANLGGTVVTVVVFIYYLIQKDKAGNVTYEKFNTTIANHLEHSSKVIEKNNEAYTQIAVTLKELCLALKKQNRGEKGERGDRGRQGEVGKVVERKVVLKI